MYVHIESLGDCPHTIQGWHHKTFPANVSGVDVLKSMADDSPLMWPSDAPPDEPNLMSEKERAEAWGASE